MQEFKPESAKAELLAATLGEPGHKPRVRKFYKASSDHELVQRMDADKDDMEKLGFTLERRVAKIGRNQACPCGSGRKFKKCCFFKAA